MYYEERRLPDFLALVRPQQLGTRILMVAHQDITMPAKVALTVTRGKLQGKEFVFAERITCILGRGDDCSPQLPNDADHQTISRHHCLLDVNPPDARIRDFGSLNGTSVNGQKIGQRQQGQTPEQAALVAFPEYDLKADDEIELGNTVFRVGIVIPVVCSACSAEIVEEQKSRSEYTPGVFVCEPCRNRTTEPSQFWTDPKRQGVCAQCG